MCDRIVKSEYILCALVCEYICERITKYHEKILFASYYYYKRSQIIEDTVEPSLPAREINLKACAPEIRTRNLPADPGIEPRPSGRPFRSVRTVPQPTEPPRQAERSIIKISKFFKFKMADSRFVCERLYVVISWVL